MTSAVPRSLFLCLLSIAIAHSRVPAFAAELDLRETRLKLYSQYANQLKQLAAWCDDQALVEQAKFTRTWLPEREPASDYIFILPESSTAPESLATTDLSQQWWSRFAQLRHAEAARLFELARSAADAAQPGLAYELVRETVREDPDHEHARKLLGFEKYQDIWKSVEAARRLRGGEIYNEKFGWLPADQLPRYERGMRFYRGNWIDAAEDARLHSNIKNGWRIDSEHYRITTNYSLEEGVQLARHLELLYDVWRQVFAPYCLTAAEVKNWLASPAPDGKRDSSPTTASPGQKLHQVTYFRDKQQYIDTLSYAHPQIGMSLGLYVDTASTVYFFHSDEPTDATLYHEATHQLFSEFRPGTMKAGRAANFWVVEGVACYMESLAEHRLLTDDSYGAYFTVGGQNGGRVPAARKRLIDDQFYIPLDQLTAMGMDAMQQDSRLRMIYSQCAALTAFLMHADNGVYRPALMEYLSAVYAGRANANTLEKLTRTRYQELDRQYREFLK
jgi:hypothetical protein